MTPSLLEVAGDTHPGRVRQSNEDSYYIIPPDTPHEMLATKGMLYVVTDGVGGQKGGQRASRLATRAIKNAYYAGRGPDAATNLRVAISQANAEICQEAGQDPSLKVMSTTVVAAVIKGNELIVAWVGDSRAYLMADGRLSRLTEDHSWVAEQTRAGVLTTEEARHHSQRNLITRCLGNKPEVVVDVSPPHQFRPGDTLLLCTDGLTEPVTEEEVQGALATGGSASETTARLIALANQRGGPDNIGVLVVKARGRSRVLSRHGRTKWLPPALVGSILIAAIVGMIMASRTPLPIPYRAAPTAAATVTDTRSPLAPEDAAEGAGGSDEGGPPAVSPGPTVRPAPSATSHALPPTATPVVALEVLGPEDGARYNGGDMIHFDWTGPDLTGEPGRRYEVRVVCDSPPTGACYGGPDSGSLGWLGEPKLYWKVDIPTGHYRWQVALMTVAFQPSPHFVRDLLASKWRRFSVGSASGSEPTPTPAPKREKY